MLLKQLKINFKKTKRRISRYARDYIAASLLSSVLTGKGLIKAGEGTNRADQDF